MEYTKKEILLKNGRTCLLRRAEESDAEVLLAYLRDTSGETPYMVREPEEVKINVEEERAFLRKMAEHSRSLMLSAYVDGRLAGSCSFAPEGEQKRLRHRCNMGISLYRKFWGMGIGTVLMEELLHGAEAAGFEQAELTVVAANKAALKLYQKLGFQSTGTIHRGFKYLDGSYADLIFMSKRF